MPASQVTIPSKLPFVGTTIFTKISKLAEDHGAINLAQGFPEFDCSEELKGLVTKYMQLGKNQYAPMAGVMPLREAIVEKVNNSTNQSYHPDTEITITSGATEALYTAISAIVRPGDEVIVFEPCYDSYVPAIVMNGGIPVFVTLEPVFQSIDWLEVKNKVTAQTKAIIVNTPHNPSGYVFTAADLRSLASIAEEYNLLVISDEVYEHIIFDGREHLSVSGIPSLAARSFVCGSFGKTFHITGWKLGYCVAPEKLMTEFRKIHQFIVFSVITPFQFAMAEFIRDSAHYEELPAFYQQKRDLFYNAIKNVGFSMTPSPGSFFQNVDYSGLSDQDDEALVERLTKEYGVAAIPVSAFYSKPVTYKTLRFCFAKNDDTLLRAAEKLEKVNW